MAEDGDVVPETVLAPVGPHKEKFKIRIFASEIDFKIEERLCIRIPGIFCFFGSIPGSNGQKTAKIAENGSKWRQNVPSSSSPRPIGLHRSRKAASFRPGRYMRLVIGETGFLIAICGFIKLKTGPETAN